ncbi:hypothetical protein DWV55_11650 [Butyricicoccus sp. AF10-3]|nr:hypothetical protein [Butyricicoccus sp. AF10-3]RHS32369.1 hypothetical protein DWV55_11650 [Butyricicoccus sp. AF10-3]
MQVLENERFRVEINEFGAELTRFTSKKDGTEYVWKGDPAAWKRHAPILFPIVGRLKDKTYTVMVSRMRSRSTASGVIWSGRHRKSATPVRNSRSRRVSTRKRCIRGILSAPCAILWTEMH